jgi:hypothetical protein
MPRSLEPTRDCVTCSNVVVGVFRIGPTYEATMFAEDAAIHEFDLAIVV